MILNNVDDIKIGTEQVDRVYAGSKLIWDAALPRGYRRCKYLESSGTQYIKLPVYATKTTVSTIEYATTDASQTQAGIFGRNNGTNLRYMVFHSGTAGKINLGLGGGYALINADLNKHTVVLNSLVPYIQYDDTFPASASGTYSASEYNYKPYLFAVNKADSPNIGKCRIYSCKMVANSSLVVDVIPALDPNGRPCMYDTVSKKPLYNSGKNEFLYELA